MFTQIPTIPIESDPLVYLTAYHSINNWVTLKKSRINDIIGSILLSHHMVSQQNIKMRLVYVNIQPLVIDSFI